MDIDEYLSEKRAVESKRDLEEAKKRLEAEKRRLKEEEARMRELERYQEPIRRGPRQPMQPWMVWNLIILFIVIAGFIINLSVTLLHEPSSTTTAETDTKTTGLTTTTGAAVAKTDLGNTTTQGVLIKPTNTTSTQSAVDLEPVPDFEVFLLYNEVDPANPSAVKADPLPQGGIIINGTDTIYYNIVLRNKEKDLIRCDGDRTNIINSGKDVDEKYYSGLKLDPFEKEELPNSISAVGDISVEWKFGCRFEGNLKKKEKTAKFSLALEG